MLTYRVLLIDTEKEYKRPIQAFFADVKNIEPWAKSVLRAAGKNAHVVVYRVNEIEIGTFKRTDYDYDKGSVPNLQPAGEEAGKPPA